MGYTAAAIIGAVGALGSAGLGVYGASQQGGNAMNPGKNTLAGYVPGADPISNALAYDAMLQMGMADPSQLAGASPIQRVRAAAIQGGNFTRDDINRLDNALLSIAVNGSLSGETNPKARAVFQRALNLAGYSDVNALMGAESAFKTQLAQLQSQGNPTNQAVRQGRTSAIEQMARIAQDYPRATATDITDLENQMYRQAQTDAERTSADQAQQILRAANMGRFNPGEALGRLSEQSNATMARSRTTAIDRAIAMLSGRQGLSNQAMAGLGGYLNQGTSALQQSAAQRTGANISAAQLAASQLDAMNQQAFTASQNANALQAQYLSGALGGITDAAQIYANYQNQQQMNQILARFGAQQPRGPAAQQPVDLGPLRY